MDIGRLSRDASISHTDKQTTAEMSGQVDAIINKYRRLSDDEVEKFHDKISKSADDVECLRQMFLIMHCARRRKLPTDVATALTSLICDQTMSNVCRHLCLLILQESSPLEKVDLSDVALDDNINVLSLLLLQNKEIWSNVDILRKILGKINASTPQPHRQIISFITHLCSSPLPLTPNQLTSYTRFTTDILRNSSIRQLPHPRSNIFRRDSTAFVTELDGAQTHEFFTVLNLARRYSPDQLANISAFSGLGALLASVRQSPAVQELLVVVRDYCVRVLMQCERRPVNKSDLHIQYSCIVECIKLLDAVCRLDEAMSASIFAIVKRIYDNYNLSPENSSEKQIILIAIASFALNHGKMVAYDSTSMVEAVLRAVATDYKYWLVAFEVVDLLKSCAKELGGHEAVVKYFPNIFKILAWRPRSFVEDFVELLPGLVTEKVAVEMLHLLVDLPCLVVAMMCAADFSVLPQITSPQLRSMFAFMLRSKCGIGDTFARLDEFHQFIQPLSNHPRVTNCGDIVPLLLQHFFDITINMDTTDHLLRLIPAILERVRLLFALNTNYITNVQETFSENICRVFARRPSLVVEAMADILDFLSIVDNFRQCNSFYTHLVWIVGEYLSTTYETEYTPKQIAAYYEALECALHELMNDELWNPSFAKLVTTMTSTLAKLSTRSQDLMSRTTLTLSKTARQVDKLDVCVKEKGIVYSRITQLIAVLQMPLAASSIFNPPFDVLESKYHRQSLSVPVVLKSLTKLQ